MPKQWLAEALLIHGIANRPSWWDRFIPVLEDAGLRPSPLVMPSLEKNNPSSWVDHIVEKNGGQLPCILIGHSLGAGAVIAAAHKMQCKAIILLGLPLGPELSPSAPPPNSGLGPLALSQVGLFLRGVICDKTPIPCPSIHFVSNNDPYVNIESARQLPYPVHLISGVGHDFNRSRAAIQEIVSTISSMLEKAE